LQYSDYTATDARAVSLAGRDPMEASANRSYRGKTTHTVNAEDMDLVVRTKQQMGDRPVIVSINILNPCVLSEIEPYADALFLTFDVQNQVVLDLVSGQCEPSALLPMQMPADMHTVEAQAEDTPRDMTCYRDADGHTYDFAFGLNWKGVIRDKRTERYK
jgi:beta-glucosidase